MLGKVLDYKDYRIMSLELVDEGHMTYKDLALMCLMRMNHKDIEDMLRFNQYDEIMEEYGL